MFAAAAFCLLVPAQAAAPDQLHLAIEAAEKKLASAPNDPRVEKSLGILLYRQDSTDGRAGELLAAAAAALPQDAEVHHFYGQWAFVNRKEPVAIAEEERALRFVGSNALARLQMLLILALAQDQNNQAAEAEKAFRQALESNRRLPSYDPMAAFQYVRFLDRQGRGRDTEPVVKEILVHAPDFGPARLFLAKSLAREGRLEPAASEAERALMNIGDDPDSVREIHYFLAKTWLQLKQPDKAQAHRDWLAQHP